MNINIVKATLLEGFGADKLFLHTELPGPFIHTELPCPFAPSVEPTQPPLVMEIIVTRGKGKQYCLDVFGIEPWVFSVSNPK